MNRLWSTGIQTTEELYASRAIRFPVSLAARWLKAVGARDTDRALEIGCAGGLLAHRLAAALPGIRVTGIDRDDGHIAWARDKTSALGLDCEFVVGDATRLPFPDECFDLCYSHTVSEHVPTEPFYREQFRVLKKGGRIAVLSARPELYARGNPACPMCAEEKALLEKAWNAVGDPDAEAGVARYGMEVRDFPKTLESAGFTDVVLDFYRAMEYAPDNADVPRARALEMIEAERIGARECARKPLSLMPNALTEGEKNRLFALIDERFIKRVALYEAGEKQWDFTCCAILSVRAVKPV